ncbi:MAG: hypothetical protein QM733_06050 [Ilumatobacteraceae bacterium]
MDEITTFARCRPEVSALDDDARVRIWQLITREPAAARAVGASAEGDDDGAAPVAPAPAPRFEMCGAAAHISNRDVPAPDADVRCAVPVRTSRIAGRRWAVLVAAGVVVLLGVGAALVSLGGRRSLDGSPATDVATVPATTPPSTTATTAPTVSTPATLAWQPAADTGSLGRSQANGVTAGPGGFVATGMGFDDERNQGRVWFSPDGLTWEEPALDVFDAKAVGAPAATSEAFYVIAVTNPDRLPNSHEGDPVPNDAHLYRSVDGRTWERWGDVLSHIDRIAAAGDTLLRLDAGSLLFWSVDGLTWTPATVPEAPAFIGLGDGNAFTPGPGPWYIFGSRDDGPVLWQSDDARTWTEIPAPPGGGRPVPTDDGLVSVFNPDTQRCTLKPLDTVPTDAAGWQTRLDAQWQCAAQLTTVRLDASSNTWVTVPEPGPGPTPIFTRLVRLGNVLVAPIIGPDRTLTIWTADQSSLHWQPDPSTTISFGDDTGSPQQPLVVASGDRVVVVGPPTAGSTGNEIHEAVFVGQ